MQVAYLRHNVIRAGEAEIRGGLRKCEEATQVSAAAALPSPTFFSLPAFSSLGCVIKDGVSVFIGLEQSEITWADSE